MRPMTRMTDAPPNVCRGMRELRRPDSRKTGSGSRASAGRSSVALVLVHELRGESLRARCRVGLCSSSSNPKPGAKRKTAAHRRLDIRLYGLEGGPTDVNAQAKELY